jgi:rhomboid family GlyGly-CTERM serine protease
MRVTPAIVAAAALTFLAPGAVEFDRLRLFELWRWLTGHLAHFSLYHYAVDAGTLLVLGWFFERAFGWRRWLLLLAVAAVAISAAFVVLEPHATYRGLSGLDCAAWAAGLVVVGRARWRVALVLGVALAAKLVYENAAGRFLFPQGGLGDMGRPVMSAHWVGALAGVVGALVLLAPRHRVHGEASLQRAALEGERDPAVERAVAVLPGQRPGDSLHDQRAGNFHGGLAGKR